MSVKFMLGKSDIEIVVLHLCLFLLCKFREKGVEKQKKDVRKGVLAKGIGL